MVDALSCLAARLARFMVGLGAGSCSGSVSASRKLLRQEAREGEVTMIVELTHRTGSILPRSVHRIRSVLALSTLVLGSLSGYWVLIEYVLP